MVFAVRLPVKTMLTGVKPVSYTHLEVDKRQDLEMFDSFVFGSKLITEENYMMTLQIRTHSADEAAPAY